MDTIDIENGACGWAVDHGDLSRPVPLELCVGALVVAQTRTSMVRDDISMKFGRRITAGFAFGTAIMATIPELAGSADDPVYVRVAGGPMLEAGVDLPSAGALAAEIVDLAGPAPPPAQAVDLPQLLDRLRADAATLAATPAEPSADGLRGYVETLVIDPSGAVWFLGWMKQGHPPAFAALVAERGRRHHAAAAILRFSRDDLPGDATGVLGMLATDWKPAADTGELQLQFGTASRFALRSHAPLRVMSFKELLSDYANLRPKLLGGGHTEDLQKALASFDSWLPGAASGQRFGAESAIDRVLLVPGLGCLVEGWVLSPMKRVESLRMRVGDAVMMARQDALYWKRRPDLLAAFPRAEAMTRRAGFVALFAGAADTADLADPVLIAQFEGGGGASWDIPVPVFRRLGHSATIEDALAFFPALQDEPFFPRFALAAIDARRQAMGRPVVIRAADGASGADAGAMVVVLPEDRCDMFLLFESLAQRRREAGAGLRLIFVASAAANRSDALWMFREFDAVSGGQGSLVLIEEADQALAALPDILREAGASRFLFTAAGIFLTEEGWAHASSALAFGRRDLVLFGIGPDAASEASTGLNRGARCFAWSTAAFCEWSNAAAQFFGGYHRDNGLSRAASVYTVHDNAAWASRALVASAIQEAVNEAVYLQREAA